MSSVRMGAGGCQFAYNWEGMWIGRRPHSLEEIIAWKVNSNDWRAYRAHTRNVLKHNEFVHRGEQGHFTSFDDVLAHWDNCPHLVANQVGSQS